LDQNSAAIFRLSGFFGQLMMLTSIYILDINSVILSANPFRQLAVLTSKDIIELKQRRYIAFLLFS